MQMIPPGAVVGSGDSVSLHQVRVLAELEERNQNKLINPLVRDAEGFYALDREVRMRMHRETFFADVFLTGANAVTLDGRLVSTDGHGNSVAPMVFGPGKVIFIIDVNKIVKPGFPISNWVHRQALMVK